MKLLITLLFLLSFSAQAGNAYLAWIPPTENTDNSPLTDLAGYKIMYGNSPDAMAITIKINNPKAKGHIVSGLEPGKYYFVVYAINEIGTSSVASNMASKTILDIPKIPKAPRIGIGKVR